MFEVDFFSHPSVSWDYWFSIIFPNREPNLLSLKKSRKCLYYFNLPTVNNPGKVSWFTIWLFPHHAFLNFHLQRYKSHFKYIAYINKKSEELNIINNFYWAFCFLCTLTPMMMLVFLFIVQLLKDKHFTTLPVLRCLRYLQDRKDYNFLAIKNCCYFSP